MNKKAVLFDLDDTLYEYSFVHQRALNNVYKVLNKYISLDFDDFKYLYELSETEILKELT
jgi:FMN phosphatase YigB (HAD superfamily)